MGKGKGKNGSKGTRVLSRRAFLQATGAAIASMAMTGGIALGKEPAVDPSLVVTFLNVGKADAIVLQSPGGAVMIDTGAASTAEDVVDALTDLGVSSLDALILSHFDQDHVGGAAAVLDGVPVKAVYVTYESKESDEIDAYHEALRRTGITPRELAVGSTLDLAVDTMDLHVIAPQASDYGENDTSNDSSLVVRLTCDGATMLFTGDIERARIDELLSSDEDLTCDLLKMPHHGGYEKNTDDLIAACAPTYAVITSSKSEKEDDETVDDLKSAGATCYLTRKGTVTATVVDGALTIAQ